MMQSLEEDQENPKGEATVMPVGELRKKHRVCDLDAECHQKRKQRTWGKSGSRRKLAATSRKSDMVKKDTRQQNQDSGKLWIMKGVLPAGIRMAHSTKVT
jgi:hypothetical protein